MYLNSRGRQDRSVVRREGYDPGIRREARDLVGEGATQLEAVAILGTGGVTSRSRVTLTNTFDDVEARAFAPKLDRGHRTVDFEDIADDHNLNPEQQLIKAEELQAIAKAGITEDEDLTEDIDAYRGVEHVTLSRPWYQGPPIQA